MHEGFGTKKSPYAYLFMKGVFSQPLKGNCTGRLFSFVFY